MIPSNSIVTCRKEVGNLTTITSSPNGTPLRRGDLARVVRQTSLNSICRFSTFSESSRCSLRSLVTDEFWLFSIAPCVRFWHWLSLSPRGFHDPSFKPLGSAWHLAPPRLLDPHNPSRHFLSPLESSKHTHHVAHYRFHGRCYHHLQLGKCHDELSMSSCGRYFPSSPHSLLSASSHIKKFRLPSPWCYKKLNLLENIQKIKKVMRNSMH